MYCLWFSVFYASEYKKQYFFSCDAASHSTPGGHHRKKNESFSDWRTLVRISLSLTTLHVTDQSNFSVWDRAYKAPCTTQEREIKKSGFLFSSFVCCCCCCRRNCRCCCCTPSRMRTLEPSRLGPRLQQQQQQQRGKKERHGIRKKKPRIDTI